MQRAHRHARKAAGAKPFHTGVGLRQGPAEAFHVHGNVPINQIGTKAVGASTAFNKTSIGGGVFSIGTPLNGPDHGKGKFRRIAKKRKL